MKYRLFGAGSKNPKLTLPLSRGGNQERFLFL
jgi:hypothetical protein